MAVGLKPPADLRAVAGARLAAIAAGIKKSGKPDLALIELSANTRVAAVFTQNAFCAAPVTVARQYLAVGAPRALLINSGNANAGTGEAGMAAAQQSCATVALALGCPQQAVLPFSTGVIGAPLRVDKIEAATPGLIESLQADNWLAAAEAIMTTDTLPKAASRSLAIDGKQFTLTGIAKGAGMIRPDMATMLAFIGTDANISQAALSACLDRAVSASFNCITVDGDTSTNDACLLFATGQAGNGEIGIDGPGYGEFYAALESLCVELAQAIVRDGEGATRFVTVQVKGAGDGSEAKRVAYRVAESPLVKTALFAGDPNWGRILAAVGNSGLEGLDIAKVDIALDDLPIIQAGAPAAEYSETAGQAKMAQAELTITVSLGRGDAGATVWTCDLSYDYVRINAEYRS